MPTEIQKLAASPWADLKLACVFRPRDPETSEPLELYITDAARLFTLPTDDPPNVAHLQVSVKGFSTLRSLSESGSFNGPTKFNRGSLFVDNTDGSLSAWLEYEWNDAEVEIRIGSSERADGSTFLYADFEPVFIGKARDIRPVGDGTFEITLGGTSISLDEGLTDERYRGFGGGVQVLAQTGGADASAVDDASFDVTGAGSLEFFGRLLLPPASGVGGLFRKTSINPNYVLLVDLDRRFGFKTASSVLWADSYLIPLDEPVALAATVSATGEVKLYAGRDARDYVEVGSGTLAPMAAVSGDFRLATYNSVPSDVEFWEIRVWEVERTYDELLASVDSPIVDPANTTGLVVCYKFPERTGTTTASEIAANPDISLTAPEWIASDEGDDPEQFTGGGALGLQKGDGWGLAFNVPLTCVDSPEVRYQWARAESVDLRRLRVAGAPMVPAEILEDPDGGAFSFSGGTVTIDPSYGISAHRLIPRQDDPLRSGQRVTITGTPSDDGDAEVLSVSADGLELVLDMTFAGASATGATIASHADDVQFTTELQKSIVQINSHPEGELTADVVVRLPADLTVSDLFHEILAVHPDTTDLEFDPIIGAFSPAGSDPPTFRKILDLAASSAFAYWHEKRDGSGYVLGTWRPPVGDPEITICESSISAISEIARAIPYRRISVGYARMHLKQDPSSLAGSLSAGERKRYGEEFAIEPFSDPRIRRQFPLSVDREMTPTLLLYRADALRWLEYGKALLMQPRRWVRIIVESALPLTVDLGSLALVYHSDPSMRMQTGRLVRIYSISEESAQGGITIEAFY